jgi:hypothetical protein
VLAGDEGCGEDVDLVIYPAADPAAECPDLAWNQAMRLRLVVAKWKWEPWQAEVESPWLWWRRR